MPDVPTASDLIAARVNVFRKANRLNREGFANLCATHGDPEVTASALANIETGRRLPDGRRRRHVTVEELLLFARVMGVTVDKLLDPTPDCEACQGQPPAGFTCNACSAGSPEAGHA